MKLLDYADITLLETLPRLQAISLMETQHNIEAVKLPAYAGKVARAYAAQDGLSTEQYISKLIYRDQHERRLDASLD